MKIKGVLVCLVFYLVFPDNIIGLWWAVGSPLVGIDANSICKKSRRLVGKQHEICRNEPEIVTEVANGVTIALQECQLQFRNRKWNCTTSHKTFRRVLRSDTREVAFINAITAAGVVYKVTQACSMGLLLQCSCDDTVKDKSTDGEWEWGGCGDNIDFGYTKSREFMDARSKRKSMDIKALTKVHNNEAGRTTIKNYMKRDCKCHGLSGSCTLKTCWRKMPVFPIVGDLLKARFDGAVKVMGANDGVSLIPEERTIKEPQSEDLIYSETSPDFCKVNKRFGTPGTQGRECDPNSMGVGGCDLLCCGRGYKEHTMTLKTNCKCRFKWCCEVICETCVTTKTIYTCL